MNIDHGRKEEIRFFFLWLSDTSLVETPDIVVLSSEHEFSAVGAKAEIPGLGWFVCDPFSVAMFNPGDIDIATHNEGDFFAIRTNHHLGGSFRHWHSPAFSRAVGNGDTDRYLRRFGRTER